MTPAGAVAELTRALGALGEGVQAEIVIRFTLPPDGQGNLRPLDDLINLIELLTEPHPLVESPPPGGAVPATEPEQPVPAHQAKQQPEPPGGGGGKGHRRKLPEKRTGIDAAALRERLQAFLDDLGVGPEWAIERRGLDLGASHLTLRNFLSGATNPYQSTLAKIGLALDRLDIKAGRMAAPPVQQLPTKFPPVTGNNLVRPSPPPRCGKTP